MPFDKPFLLGKFGAAMAEAAMRADGVPDRFTGCGIAASFGAAPGQAGAP